MLALALLSCVLGLVSSHVTLTYPAARVYNLDFLDNQRTNAPCGVPKGESRTVLQAGTSINVTWHLAYPHKGGFKLEILDPSERPLRDLTPRSNRSEFVEGDPTAVNYLVNLPEDLECKDCSIRLIRQAGEWGSSYKFWSCADVDIVLNRDYRNTCSGHGRSYSGRCRCDRLYYGDYCQYQDECIKDEDCGDHGTCVDVKATSAPVKQCFCQLGFFGPGCSQRSPVNNKRDINTGLYTEKKLGEKMTLYWRILKDLGEIEMIMKVKGTSWAGVGWRPRNTDATCKNFPLIGQSERARSLDLAELNLDPRLAETSQPEPESSPKAKSGGEPQGEPEPKSEPNPESRSNDEPVSEPVSEPKSEPSTTTTQIEPLREVLEKTDDPLAFALEQPKEVKRVEKSVDVGISYVKTSVSSSSRRRRAPQDQVEAAGEKKPRAFAIPIIEEEGERGNQSNPDTGSSVPTATDPKPEPSSDGTTLSPFQTNFDPTVSSPFQTDVEPTSQPEAEPAAVGEPEPASEPTAAPEPAAAGLPEPEPEPESEPEPEPEPAVAGGTKWSPRGELNGMDCVDMVIGMARGSTSRVWDFYTRDRSTPQRDTYWGGESDLTAALAWEEDGETTIFFRKKLEANGPSDHTIVEDEMHVIWAVGQEAGMYSHVPASGLEAETPSIADFYRPDELKYHGAKNRGMTSINFFEEDQRDLNDVTDLTYCGNEFKYPNSCSLKDKNCEYYAKWEYNENADLMNFTIVSNNPNKWTGIGFSTTPMMSQTDAIIGWVEPNGRFFLMDMWANNYLMPELENRQDITQTSGLIEDGFTTLKFTRKRDTNDPTRDVAFTDTEGMYMIFPVKGGRYNGVNKKIKKHEATPIVSTERILIKSCRTDDGKPTYTVTQKPPQLLYTAQMKFIKLAESYQLPPIGSREYTELEAKISKSLSQTNLEKVPGFQGVQVTKFSSKNQGEFVTDLVIVIDKTLFEADKAGSLTVETALQETVRGGRVGNLFVDTESLVMSDVKSTEESPSDSAKAEEPNIKLYVVVACIAALVVVAIMQASCTIYKLTRRGSSIQKEKLIGQQSHQWKDYVSQPPPYHNYAHDAFEQEDPKGWGQSRHSSERSTRANQHSLPRGSHVVHPAQAYPMGYSSYDRRAGGFGVRSPAEYPPDHYFMPSQRKYAGEELRVYVDYNK